MKINRVFAKQINFPMNGELRNTAFTFNTKEVVFVFVESNTDVIGVGELWSFYGSASIVVDIINKDFAPLVIGEDPHFIERIRERITGLAPIGKMEGVMVNALSGLDIALWDLRAKILDIPLYQLLGAHSNHVYTYASGGLYGPNKTASDLGKEVKGYRDDGFTGVKIKVGGLSQREDIERIAAARKALGPDARLMIDAMHAYTVPEALGMARKALDHDIYWFESPVALVDTEGHAIVNSQGGIPVCANESLHSCEAFSELIRRRGAEYAHFDLCVCGGITEARKIAAVAQAHGVPIALHAANAVCLFSASVHFAASVSNCDSVENHQVHRWLNEYAPSSTMKLLSGSRVSPLDSPGHGMDFLTPEFIDNISKEIIEAAV